MQTQSSRCLIAMVVALCACPLAAAQERGSVVVNAPKKAGTVEVNAPKKPSTVKVNPPQKPGTVEVNAPRGSAGEVEAKRGGTARVATDAERSRADKPKQVGAAPSSAKVKSPTVAKPPRSQNSISQSNNGAG